jgi:hypothetical protein
VTKLDALFAFCFWIAIASAFAVLFSRIAKLNDQPDHDPANDDSRFAEVAHLPCERRSRGETRNGIGGPA